MNGDNKYPSIFGHIYDNKTQKTQLKHKTSYPIILFYNDFFDSYNEVINENSNIFEIYEKLFAFIESKIDNKIKLLSNFTKYKYSELLKNNNLDEISKNQNTIYETKIFDLKRHIIRLKDICNLLLNPTDSFVNETIKSNNTDKVKESLKLLIKQVTDIINKVMKNIEINLLFDKEEYDYFKKEINESVENINKKDIKFVQSTKFLNIFSQTKAGKKRRTKCSKAPTSKRTRAKKCAKKAKRTTKKMRS